MFTISHFPVQTGHARVSFHDGYLDPRGPQHHCGVDIGSTSGTIIYAAENAEVVRHCRFGGEIHAGVDHTDRSGNFVILVDVHRHFHAYLHMRDPSNLTPGQKLNAGSIVGYMGNTGIGRGHGPIHLHFQVFPPFTHAGADEEYRSLEFTRTFGRAVNPYDELERLAHGISGARFGTSTVAGRQNVRGVVISPPAAPAAEAGP